jgi:hypothetical protein
MCHPRTGPERLTQLRVVAIFSTRFGAKARPATSRSGGAIPRSRRISRTTGSTSRSATRSGIPQDAPSRGKEFTSSWARSCYRRRAVLRILCNVVVTDANAQPPIVEARFLDALGEPVVIVDKEPIFVADQDEPGEGGVCCMEVARRSEGARTVVTVSLDAPDGLVTTDGRRVLDVLDSSVELAV